jgi:type I restriction enzyme S subunit
MGSVIDNPTIKKHSLYKDSGVKWLEKIPSNWHSKPLFTIGKVISKVNCQDRELLSVYLERGVIKFSDVTEKRTNVTSEDLSKYQAVDPGNLVLNNQQAWRGSVGVSKYSGIVSPAYIVLALSDEIDYDFANYLFRDSTMVSHYLICSKGVGTIQRNLYWPQLKRVNVCIPPLSEQTAIAEFLDRKTALIDQAIDIKQKQIELLKERRQILIHKAVTRGLNPDVKMKNSGNDVVGDIPEHWQINKLRNSLKPISIKNHPHLPLLSITRELGVIERNIDDPDENHNFIPEDLSGYKLIKAGQFGMNKMKAWQGSYGISSYTGIVSPAYFVFDLISDIEPAFFHLAIRSKFYIPFFVQASDGVRIGQWDLSKERMKEIPIIIPPVNEQIQIVDFIERATDKILVAINAKEIEIEKLKEYKATLINSAVTGKIKVYNDAK